MMINDGAMGYRYILYTTVYCVHGRVYHYTIYTHTRLDYTLSGWVSPIFSHFLSHTWYTGKGLLAYSMDLARSMFKAVLSIGFESHCHVRILSGSWRPKCRNSPGELQSLRENKTNLSCLNANCNLGFSPPYPVPRITQGTGDLRQQRSSTWTCFRHVRRRNRFGSHLRGYQW